MPMQFRTAIDIKEQLFPPLKHDGSVLLMGSCFSDNMGVRLQGAMVDAVINPFGTTYNPISLCECIDILVSGKSVAADDMFSANGLWNHFMFHSRFSGMNREAAMENMNASIMRGHEQLARCSHLFVTLGTSFVYRLAESGLVVNNCHKLPSANFVRSLCSIDEIVKALDCIAAKVHGFNAGASIIFTVSPIRHLADGLPMNHLSKSLLTVATHQVVSLHSAYCHYFPAYEILNDDLRDYRFYAADMAHPSDVAVNYVWELFKTAFFNDTERQKAEQCERLSRMLAHKPMSSNTEAVKQFVGKVRQSLADMALRYPHITKLDYLKHYITCKEL